MHLTDSERCALTEIKTRISALFPVRQYILFGSKARGEAREDSDIDLLIVTGRELSYEETRRITHEIFHVNLSHDTLFSYIAVDEEKWNSCMYRLLPIHSEIERDGVLV